ncbi:MAG TPA: hypothetical protein VMU54_17740 [Planctomycetota bacterium]|nr:hypothetical protein [Planctomycetota bacterium]
MTMARLNLESSIFLLCLLFGGPAGATNQQVTGQDLDRILARADALLDETRKLYEEARTRGSGAGFVEAGFKLEEARIKYLVLQEIGDATQQKTVADRIRTVNQLGKLIHDGRVAVTGTPSDAPPKPSLPSPTEAVPASPAPNPPATPAPNPEAASPARLPVPGADKQRDAERLVRDVFKEQYARKAPADRQALARSLLIQTKEAKDDPATLWVLYRDARELAVQGGDPDLTVEAVEAAARVFDIDPLATKNAALVLVAKNTRTPGDSLSLVNALLVLVDELLAADQYDLADKAVGLALQSARRTGDVPLAFRVSTRSGEVAEAKSLFQSLKAVVQTMAVKPEDPPANAEMGQFLCFVKGSWDLGMRFLAKGSDPTLQSLAAKELAHPLQSAELSAIADGWMELASKEKSSLKKPQMTLHAKSLYEAALPEATGLLKVKVEKRIRELGGSSGIGKGAFSGGAPGGGKKEVDLLALVDLKLDTYSGAWQRKGDTLIAPASGGGMNTIRIPFTPPDEYELRCVVSSPGGAGSIDVGLLGPAGIFSVVIDGWSPSAISGLHFLDGQAAANNETANRSRVFGDTKPKTLVFAVLKDGVKVTVDSRPIINWKGELSRLTFDDGAYRAVTDRRSLFLGAWQAYQITKLELTPISGQGRKLR